MNKVYIYRSELQYYCLTKYVSMYKPYSAYSASGYIGDPTATVRHHPSVPGDGRWRTELEGFVEHREKSTRGNVYILDFLVSKCACTDYKCLSDIVWWSFIMLQGFETDYDISQCISFNLSCEAIWPKRDQQRVYTHTCATRAQSWPCRSWQRPDRSRG